MTRHLVVVHAYDQLATFEFGCAVEIFGTPRAGLGVKWYDFAVCAVDRGPIRADGGISIRVPASKGLLERADTIIIPGWRGIDAPVPRSLQRRLRDAHARGCRLCSICSGVFVLAAAGLVAGRTVTTHWRVADALAKRYPDLDVQSNALYVDEGQIVTSAGSAAGLDMMLHLVRRDYGARIANQVAQRLVIPPHREGGQAQFLPRLLLPPDQNRLSPLMEWVRANIKRQHSVESLARRAAMSARTLQRSFVDATGLSAYDWLIRERVAYAKDLLEAPSAKIGKLAEAAGFGSEESFRRHFRRVIGTSPTAYRKQFARS